MATIKGLWELNDSLMTWEGLPIGYEKEVNINGRVWKSGLWQPFVKLIVEEQSKYSGWKNNLMFHTVDGEHIDIIDGFQWWTGFKVDRIVDFGNEFQEIDDVVYNFITTNATQVEFNDIFIILNGNFKWKSILADGSYFNGISLDIKGTMMQPEDGVYDGFVFMIPDEDTANEFGLTPGVWSLAKLTANMDTGEQFLQTYQNGVWSSEEARNFTLNNKTLSKSLATYILANTESTASKGPNYTALNDALDRLAAAIAAKTGAELPLTLEEMLVAAKENDIDGIQTVNVTLEGAGGELSNETSVGIKFQTASRELNYLCFSGGSPFRDNIRPDNLLLKVQPIAYIWQSKEDSLAGYKINGSALINAGVGYENATEVVLKDGDVITLISTNLD